MQVTVGFALFLTWLYSIPLEGAILPPWVDAWHVFYFLGAHTVAFVLASRMNADRLAGFTRFAFPMLGMLTFSLLFIKTVTLMVCVLMGLVAAPLIVSLLNGLRTVTRPVLAVTGGLWAANLMMLAIHAFPMELTYKVGGLAFMTAAAGPLVWRRISFREPAGVMAEKMANAPESPLRYYCLLFVIFYVTGGLMHGYTGPALQQAGEASRSYVAGYLVLIPLCALLLKKAYDATVYLAVILGVAGFSLLAGDQPVFRKISMFLTQASFGCADLMVIALAIAPERKVAEQFRIMTGMCAGILLGSVIVMLFSHHLPVLVVAANVVLVISLAAFTHLKLSAISWNETRAGMAGPFASLASLLSPAMLKRLSAMEKNVLAHVVDGKTYKETGALENIAESTVKTYMQRIFQKFGCGNKKELLQKIQATAPQRPRKNA